MSAHIFREKAMQIVQDLIKCFLYFFKLWWCFTKSHLTLLLYSTEADCPTMRASISELKQLQHLQWCSSCNKVNEAAIAKPSALLIARFKQHFHSHWDSPGIKSKEAKRLRDALDTLTPRLWARIRYWHMPGRPCPAWLLPSNQVRVEGTHFSALGRVMMGIEKQVKLRPGWSFAGLQTPQRVKREAQVNNSILLSSFSSPFHTISWWKTPRPFPHTLYLFCLGPLDYHLVLQVSSWQSRKWKYSTLPEWPWSWLVLCQGHRSNPLAHPGHQSPSRKVRHLLLRTSSAS